MRTTKTVELGKTRFEYISGGSLEPAVFINGEPFQLEDIGALVEWLSYEVLNKARDGRKEAGINKAPSKPLEDRIVKPIPSAAPTGIPDPFENRSVLKPEDIEKIRQKNSTIPQVDRIEVQMESRTVSPIIVPLK